MNLWGELPATAVIFAACDSVYFLEHAPALVYSADKIAKNVHLHVCNPTPEVYSLACVLTSTVNIAVTFSFNEVNFPAALNDSARQTYFACLRFLVLPEILPSAGRVLTVDVDYFFNADFDYPDASLGYFPREPLSSSDARIKAGSHVAAGGFLAVRRKPAACEKDPGKYKNRAVELVCRSNCFASSGGRCQPAVGAPI